MVSPSVFSLLPFFSLHRAVGSGAAGAAGERLVLQLAGCVSACSGTLLLHGLTAGPLDATEAGEAPQASRKCPWPGSQWVAERTGRARPCLSEEQ